MPESQYEYDVEPFSLIPSELENAKFAFNDVLNAAIDKIASMKLDGIGISRRSEQKSG